MDVGKDGLEKNSGKCIGHKAAHAQSCRGKGISGLKNVGTTFKEGKIYLTFIACLIALLRRTRVSEQNSEGGRTVKSHLAEHSVSKCGDALLNWKTACTDPRDLLLLVR